MNWYVAVAFDLIMAGCMIYFALTSKAKWGYVYWILFICNVGTAILDFICKKGFSSKVAFVIVAFCTFSLVVMTILQMIFVSKCSQVGNGKTNKSTKSENYPQS